MKIAVLLTCFNRKLLTISCLEHLLKARDSYNATHEEMISLSFFVTDDKCTDGTPNAIKDVLQNEPLTIVPADGNAYWAGGMRMAWRKAIESGSFDFYLLLNDDTDVWKNLFDELLEVHRYSLENFACCGIYSGNTTQKDDKSKITFGGKKEYGRLLKRNVRLSPNGVPQECDVVNANILLVPQEVVNLVGIFPDCYIHSAADNDYAKRVYNHGFKVFITANFCGSCDADNYDVYSQCKKIKLMSIKERREYFSNPVRSLHDSLEYYRNWKKMYIPIAIVRHFLQIYFPMFYFRIFNRNRMSK